MISYYYPQTIKTLCVAIANVFNGLVVKVYDKDGKIVKSIKVPVSIGPQDKVFQERKTSESGERYYSQFPKMALEIQNVVYDTSRAAGSNEFRHFYDDALNLSDLDGFFQDINPSPYNFNFTLRVRTLNMDDMVQLVEQILPYFNPYINLRIKEFSFLNLERNIQVINDGGVSIEFDTEMEANDKRVINGTFDLLAKGFLYKPFDKANIIKFIKSQYFIGRGTENKTEQFETVGYEPENAFKYPETFLTSAYDPSKDIYTFGKGESFT